MTVLLPAADTAQVRRAVLGDLRADRPTVAAILALNVLAAGAGLVGPWLLGRIVDTVRDSPGAAAVGTVDRLAVAIAVSTVAQIVLARFALYAGYRFGERTAGRIRERFFGRALAMPAVAVEHIPSGDLIARGTTDAATVAATLRRAVPDVFTASVQALFLIGAVLFLNPLLGLCGLSCLLILTVVLRWYLRRARTAYLAEAATGSQLADVVATTASGARTIEALRLAGRRAETADTTIAAARQARLRTLRLRTVLLPSVDISYVLPVVGVLLAGNALYHHGSVSLGTVIAAAVYLRQLIGPLDTLTVYVEQLQSATASYARVEGLASTPQAERSTSAQPDGDRIRVTDARYAYGSGRDVLHGVDLDVRPGERLAVVGPSGAGKSTLGRLLAGIDRPRTGAVTVGGVPVADLPPDRLRRQIVLVTQEHHVFRDTVRDNLLIARPDGTDAELLAALSVVDADWVDELPDGLDTELGGDAYQLDGSQAQQLALARVVLADPHALMLDEATALLDPASARNTERALAAVMQERTVIAVAHRLQTAHEADRIAMMEAGRIVELGSHAELVARGGAYGQLWRSWHQEGQ